MVSVRLPSDALLQHLLSYLGFSYLGRGVSLHGYSSKAQLLLLTLDEGYLLTVSAPDLERETWTSAVATGLEKVRFHSNPKERQCQRMLKLLHNCTHLAH